MGVGPVSAAGRPAVIPDRDDTLVETAVRDSVPRAARSMAQLGSCRAFRWHCGACAAAGFLLIVVTKSAGRGTRFDRPPHRRSVHDYLMRELPLDGSGVAFAMMQTTARVANYGRARSLTLPISLAYLCETAFVVGERWRVIEAGKRAGCPTVLLRHWYSGDNVEADFEVSDFGEAAGVILQCREVRT